MITAALIMFKDFNLSLLCEIVKIARFGLSPVGIIQLSELFTLILIQALFLKTVFLVCKLSVKLFTHILVKIALNEIENVSGQLPYKIPLLNLSNEGQIIENHSVESSYRKRALSLKLESLLEPVFNKRKASFDSESLHSEPNHLLEEMPKEMCKFDLELMIQNNAQKAETELTSSNTFGEFCEDFYKREPKEQSRKRSGCFPILPKLSFDKTKRQVRSLRKNLSKRRFSFVKRKKSEEV